MQKHHKFLKWLKRPKNKLVQRFNEFVAIHITMIFGTMWTTYLFFFYGFLPLIFPKYMNSIMYWSTTVQLWSLPLIMVGQNVMGRASELRAQETHETVMQELALLKEQDKINKEQLKETQDVMIRMSRKLNYTGHRPHHGKI